MGAPASAAQAGGAYPLSCRKEKDKKQGEGVAPWKQQGQEKGSDSGEGPQDSNSKAPIPTGTAPLPCHNVTLPSAEGVSPVYPPGQCRRSTGRWRSAPRGI